MGQNFYIVTLVKVKNSSQKILSADCQPTVFVMLQTKVLAGCYLSVTCWQCVGKSCAEMIANRYLFIASTTTLKWEKLITER